MNQMTKEDFLQGYSPDKVFITSDLHLYHTNIIKYCNRQFKMRYLVNTKILQV